MANIFASIRGSFTQIAGISLGLFILLVQLWMLVNVEIVFPQDPAFFERILIIYLVMQASIFALPDLRNKLFNLKLVKAFPKFLLFATISIVLLSVIGAIFTTGAYQTILQNFTAVTVGILLMHSFIVAVIEELMFRDFIEVRVGRFWQAIFFAIFHWTVWGGHLLLLAFGFGLGLLFSWIKWRFSPQDNIANIAVHFGYNAFVLGLFT